MIKLFGKRKQPDSLDRLAASITKLNELNARAKQIVEATDDKKAT